MKKYNNKIEDHFAAAFLLLLVLLSGIQSTKAQDVNVTPKSGYPNQATVTVTSVNNPCVLSPNTSLYYLVSGVTGYITISTNTSVGKTYTINLNDCVPGNTYSLTFKFHYTGTFCNKDGYSYKTYTMPAYQPVSNVQATDEVYPDKIKVTWNLAEAAFNSRSYRVYSNGTQVSGNLPAGTKTFFHTGLIPADTNTYSVRAVVNGALMNAPAGDDGSTFDIDLKASNNEVGKVILTWKNFNGTYNPDGYLVERSNGILNNLIYDCSYNIYTSYEDAATVLIPGFTYKYTIRVKPPDTSRIVDSAYGKVRPDGKISGTVKTPATSGNPTGIGVPGVRIVVRLQGTALPTDTTTTYSAVTDANGAYEIKNIYYYQSANFTVTPEFMGRIFNPTRTNITLDPSNHNVTVNFTDMSSFTVSGTIMQGSCPMAGVQMLVDGDSTSVATDKNGRYSITISNGGSYTIRPILEKHLFSPAERSIIITDDTSGVDFTDTTVYILEGHFLASCQTYIGVAELRFYSTDTGICFSDTVISNSSGYYSIGLPSRSYHIDLLQFTSFNESILPSITVRAYFSQTRNLDLTFYDSLAFHHDTAVMDFIYRLPPKLTLCGLDKFVTCSGDFLPVLQQHALYNLEFRAMESFNSTNCPAGKGHIIITENISSNGIDMNTDTLYYELGDSIHYTLIAGGPNIILPYKKFIQAILFRDNQTDTVYSEAIVVGHRPRSQTFTTTTPQIPFHILHNPPGDGSYSYLEQYTSFSNSFTTSFLQQGSVNTYIRTQLGPVFALQVGMGVAISSEIKSQFDITGNFGSGLSYLTNDASVITSTTLNRFQTMGNGNITGSAGDVFIGGALNMLYALSDVLSYDFDSCKLKVSRTLMMQPNGIATTFMYTEKHITDVIIPELESIKNYYISINEPDSAAYFANQLNVWQQVIDNNRENIANARFIENKTYSSGLVYENSVQTKRSKSSSVDFNYYIDYGVAIDIGASISGVGLFGGVAIKGKSEWGSVTSNDSTGSVTVGYVLSDDDPGDSYTLDIMEDKVYGVPAFKVVAGRSSCPWEKGTLPREGVQLLSDKYSQWVEESQAAVFILQLGNTSQSNELRTYNFMLDHSSNPDGAVITIGGSPVVGDVPYPYTIPAGQGTNVTVTVRKGPVASDYNGLKFMLKSPCDKQIFDDVFLDVHFYKVFNLTISLSGSGNTNVPAGKHTYQEGSSVILYASPSQGNIFQKWIIGNIEYLTQAVQVIMDSNMTAIAYFVPSTYPQFTLQLSNTGNGTSIPPPGTHYFNSGDTVTLHAIPDLQHAFVKWVIDGIEVFSDETRVVMTKNISAYAYFVKTYSLNVEVTEGEGVTYPPVGNNTFPDSSVIYLYASPLPGFEFDKWMIDTAIYTTQCVEITLKTDLNVKAYFIPTTLPQDTLIIADNGGGITIPPSGKHYFIYGSTITLSAHPNKGKAFEKWIINSIESTKNPVNITITGDVSVQAFFRSISGINENELITNIINLYPNPANCTVNFKSAHPILRLSIFDISGRVVYDKININSTIYSVNLENLNSGMYIARLRIPTGTYSLKLQVIKE